MQLAVLSNENLNPGVPWTTLGPPLARSLARFRDCRIIAPPPLSHRHLRKWAAVARAARSVDTLFWMQGRSRPDGSIFLTSVLAARARRSIFIFDTWKYLIPKIGALAALQRLDPCFVANREGYRELKCRFPRGRFEWLPFGVDTEAFRAVPGERPIFAYWMGRRYESLHQAMMQYCASRGLEYRFTGRDGEFPSSHDLGRLVGSSRYFLVAPPNLASPDRTGGYSPFVMRYFEGLSAGARLVGVLPGSGEYEKLLPLDAILQVAPDGSDLAAKLDADRQNPEVWLAVERARMDVRSNHSWSRRAEQIYYRLREGTPTGFDQD